MGSARQTAWLSNWWQIVWWVTFLSQCRDFFNIARIWNWTLCCCRILSEECGGCVVTHQTCLVLWTWRKLADETNAKNTQDLLKDCPNLRDTDSPRYPYHAKSRLSLCEEWIQPHCSHLSHKNDYSGARDDCRHLAVIPHMRTAKKQKNPMNNDLFFGMRKERSFCSPTPIPEQSKKQKKRLRNEGEKESFLAPKCQI